MRGTRCAALGATLSIIAGASAASAYTIDTGVTPSCHEQMSIEAFRSLNGSGEAWASAEVPIPSGRAWRKVAGAVVGPERDEEDAADRLVVVSLALGSRAPDTEGGSVTNVLALRDAHASPRGQEVHFLRNLGDDGAIGDERAFERGRRSIRDSIQTAIGYTQFPPDRQLIEIKYYTDFYGRISVDVWAPAYHLGIALHTVQDSFSHTVRDAELRRVRAVMTFVDALDPGFEPERDGPAHSSAMDECDRRASAIAEVAQRASAEMIAAAAEARREGTMEPVDAFLDRWFVYEPSCDKENRFCDSPWTELAQTDRDLSLLPDQLGCAVTRRPGPSSGAVVALALIALARARGRRRRQGRPNDSTRS